MKNILFILSFLMSFNSFAQNKKSFLRDGNTLYTDSSYNEAEMQYRKSLEKDQDYFNASFNLADAVYKQERYEESSALFDALKDNAPTETDLAQVFHNLGNSLVKEGKLDDAIAAYKNALRINPNDNETRHNLAFSKQQKQEQEQQEEENKNEQEEDKEGDKKKEQKDKEQEKEEKNKNQEENKENQKQNQPEEKKEDMSKEDAEKMLEAIQQQEKDLQEELQKKKFKGKRMKVLKDW
jgi:Ca-activated chloride channel family protein